MISTTIEGRSVDLEPSEFRKHLHAEVARIVEDLHAMNLVESAGGHVPFLKRADAEYALKYLLSVGAWPDDKLGAFLLRQSSMKALFPFLENAVSRLVEFYNSMEINGHSRFQCKD